MRAFWIGQDESGAHAPLSSFLHTPDATGRNAHRASPLRYGLRSTAPRRADPARNKGESQGAANQAKAGSDSFPPQHPVGGPERGQHLRFIAAKDRHLGEAGETRAGVEVEAEV